MRYARPNTFAKPTRRSAPALEGVLDLKLLQIGRLEPLLLDLFQVRVPATFGNQERTAGVGGMLLGRP